MLLSTKKPLERKIMSLFRKLKLQLHIFQQSFTPDPHRNKVRAKPPWVQSIPIILARPTIPISDCFKSYWYIKKYADSWSQTKVVCFLWLLLALVPLLWLHKEMNRLCGLNQHSLFPMATASTRSSASATYKICRQWNTNQRSSFPKAIASTRSFALAT